MATPQQPELRRAGRNPTDQDSWAVGGSDHVSDEGNPGPVPPDNQPGHHPEHEQDKPL